MLGRQKGRDKDGFARYGSPSRKPDSQNILAIKDLVFSKINLIPAEHREVTLAEFKASAKDTGSIDGKPER